ncbi:MAG TPA: rhombosortase [Gammaproteobacteria bacterium]|nr:rhombosortase [Gammaproteobacteria bacterium]
MAVLAACLRRHHLPLLLGLIALVLAAAGESATEVLRFDRAAIAQGQGWRLLSGNLVHLGWVHLLLNLAGLGLIWLLVHDQWPTAAWWLIMLISSLAVGLGLWWFNPELMWYVGLSGALHGLFAAGAAAGAARRQNWEAWALLAAVTAKLAWEQYAGPLPGSAEAAGGPVIVDAHLYGAAGGAGTAALLLLLPRRCQPGRG